MFYFEIKIFEFAFAKKTSKFNFTPIDQIIFYRTLADLSTSDNKVGLT